MRTVLESQYPFTSVSLREQYHVADASSTEKHHAQPIDADADAAGRGHSVLQRYQEVFIQLLLLAACLMFEAFALFNWIVLFRVARRNLLAVDAQFEDFGHSRGART